jgi:hypothetical protein
MMSQGNLSYCKIHPLHSLFKGCIGGHYNHYILNTFYPAEEDRKRERRYCFFTYNGAYTMPRQAQRKQVGGTNSTSTATGSLQPSINQATQLLQQETYLTKIQIQKMLSPFP